MAIALTLLDDVRWQGNVVAGDRPRALLAALAASGGRPVRDERLIELVWGGDAPANATKSLQVLVSRTRAACGAEAIARDATGYRLGVGPAEVDSVRLAALVRDAATALDDDAAQAARLAREALTLADGIPPPSGNDDPLASVRRAAAEDVEHARVILARASSRTGGHDALGALETAHAQHPDDEPLLADLLRSEATARGPGAALERYERYRTGLRERLGASPGERLQRAHRDLLALDRPQRQGVRYDATPLLGRDGDIATLQGLIASTRVVSIVGPGGLGKTRVAHVLARGAAQPVVHVVELAGVTDADDVVAEVGSVLGVRDSVTSRRTLTPEQRIDVRARVAQRLAQAPSLLVLDNCEHLVGAVAELVAFLVSTTADLHVLTTSRAPLAIAAERVYLLAELDTHDAARLFRERALAARPGAQLAGDVVERIVTRLDGLPLAIELAAAKVRAMAVEEIDRRLEDRFALLRGGDRSAPDRHRTLLAVIDWSWNLLTGDERRALARLALFNDGFTLAAAGDVLGEGALDAVQGLVDQSLLSVRETGAGVRYRMLETVREFGRLQLADDEREALAARRRWAGAYARRHGARLPGVEQLAAIDAIAAEETNLADELREALAGGDRDTLIPLLAALGLFWTMRGEHGRMLALSRAISDAVNGWTPPPELEPAARAALSITLSNGIMTIDHHTGPIRDLLVRLGPGEDPRIAGVVRVLLEYDRDDAAAFERGLLRHAEDPDRNVALAARQWLSHYRENAGEPVAAIDAATRGLELADPESGPWLPAILHTQCAQLAMQLGERDRALEHARAALPVMERLGANDDSVQLRSLLALCAVADGRLDDAEAELERMGHLDDDQVFGGFAVRRIGSAELALARGDHAGGLRAYRQCAANMDGLQLPGIPATGLEPWALFGYATALAAHAHYAAGTDVAHGTELFRACRDRGVRLLEFANPYLDFPALGSVLFGLGAWGLLQDAAPRETSLALLVLAERLAYNRTVPTMAWERIALPEFEPLWATYEGRRPTELLDEVRRYMCRL